MVDCVKDLAVILAIAKEARGIERKCCAKLADEMANKHMRHGNVAVSVVLRDLSNAIRERSEA